MSSRSVGVEEELLLVEPETGQPQAVAETVLAAAQQAGAEGRDGGGAALEFELKQQQLETNSEPCRTLGELHREIRRGRAAAAAGTDRTTPDSADPAYLGQRGHEDGRALWQLFADNLRRYLQEAPGSQAAQTAARAGSQHVITARDVFIVRRVVGVFSV